LPRRAIYRSRRPSSSDRRRPSHAGTARRTHQVLQAPSTADREFQLVAYTTRASDSLAGADSGADLIRALTDQSRLSLLVRHHEPTLGVLLRGLGTSRTEALLTEFLAATPASAWPDEQSRVFTSWLETRPELLALIRRGGPGAGALVAGST
jgi:hypothetical protein